MRCLLDKAAARRIMEALFKLASAQELTVEEIHALGLYERAGFPGMRLFIVPPTDNVLKRLAQVAAYAPLIAFFRPRVEVIIRSTHDQQLAGATGIHQETPGCHATTSATNLSRCCPA
jgi:hypothetical protein